MKHEANHSPPCSAKVKNARSYTFTSLNIVMVVGVMKHGVTFTGTYYQRYMLRCITIKQYYLSGSSSDSILSSHTSFDI
jgi:hypothetical protein